MVTLCVCSKLKTSWNWLFANTVGKNSQYFVGIFNKTIPLALVGDAMIIANLVLHTSLAIYHLISRVRTHLERPWRSFDFEIKIQGLESSWKLQSVVESPWISVLTLSNPDSQLHKKGKKQKDLQDEIAHVVEELKKIDSRLFFHWMESLKVLEKSLKFLFKKGYKPWISKGHLWNNC